ncbi:MAG: methyltransferase domain-containing protein [Actinomycetia bacterium]|nr:methyltransferase domain-containing protein [Actinomycetes bacterium]
MRPSVRLVLASALMLFLELVLIRWLGANVVHLGYFTNFVLLGSFLGIGLGFVRASRRPKPPPWPAVILLLMTAAVFVFPVGINRSDSDVLYFTNVEVTGPPMWLSLPLLFIAVALVMVGPADLVAREFQKLAPLTAYRWDLVGSLIGIASFTGLAFAGVGAAIWGVVVALLWLALSGPRPSVVTAASLLAFSAILIMEASTVGLSWSPYSKLTLEEIPGGTLVSANGVPHQAIQTIETKLANEPQYGLPYDRVATNPPGDVLIVGAGTGNDVAIALDRGATSVTAVEIDPKLLDLGEELHPDHPYDDPRVTTINDDGRAFLERTDQSFDLILFALPDSLTLVNGAGGVRLESYLFTQEAMDAAHERLTPTGGFAMYNYYREDWLIDRLNATVATTFGHEPCVDRIGDAQGQAVLSANVDFALQRCANTSDPVSADAPAPARDDRPFVYVKDRSIPPFYLLAVGVVILISLAMTQLFSGGRLSVFPYRDLFFMGAAFLLLETKSVTTFALLFGTTWLVNAIVFAGILLTVLLAVEVTARIRTPRLAVVYALLGMSLAIAYVVSNTWILGLPVIPRALVACTLAFAPIFFANIAFAKRFANSSSSTDAFAVNVIGAMVGGCMEYLALITGYRALLIVVGLLYLAAFLLRPKESAGAEAVTASAD